MVNALENLDKKLNRKRDLLKDYLKNNFKNSLPKPIKNSAINHKVRLLSVGVFFIPY
jgi:hypothetical protein